MEFDPEDLPIYKGHSHIVYMGQIFFIQITM